ncbi:GyrI-like domain-containing protein [Halobacillus shinanisalinarum]|uniref:GyrI-like domain-containing protein n=1 Tax=Halobacillus shinanisalinarum TaxID=2932258 RepID=A0ABY4GXF6_9BACI|nr:effector binding domain-containing protein [Halobacillus shinanisalinarum]UOQ92734.1 GyrI-like domain-containing protein [Halobacillus shinanisalinarum]
MEETSPITLNGVREVDEKKLVGFCVLCNDTAGYGQEIPKAFMTLERRKDEIKQLVEPVKLIGSFKASETSKEEDGYWVCYEVHDFEEIPERMVSLVVPSQKYGVLNFKGQSSEIYKVYTYLHQWIGENGYNRVPDKWTLEIYSKWTEYEDNVDLCDPIF